MMEIYIEGHPDTHWMAHLLDEPGCIWIAEDKDKLMAQGLGAVDKFMHWLEQNGEPRRRLHGKSKLEVADIQEIPQLGQSGAAVAIFTPDYNRILKEDIALVIRRLGYARRELLELVTALHVDVMDWQPPGGKRTLRQNLEHICNCQWFYLSRILGMDLQDRVTGSRPEDTMQALHWMQQNITRILLGWPPTLSNGVFKLDKPSEDWTPRKMLRRILEHELEHLWVIRRTIIQELS